MNLPDRKHLVIGLLLLAAVIFGFGFKAGQAKSTDIQPLIDAKGTEGAAAETEVVSQIKETTPVTVTVHVAGAVERPGVYSFPAGTRVNEGIAKAGPLKEAELSYINLAEIMTDQQQIIVSRHGQLPPVRSAAAGISGGSTAGNGYSAAGALAGKVNINTAGAAVLEKLPGIGPVTAKRIIDYRTEKGQFKDVIELRKVEGIGEKKFTRLKEKVTI